jgi:microcystin-dependent protein
MKAKLFFITLFIVFGTVFAQVVPPQGFSYQAIARDANGVAMSNQRVTLRLTILKGIPTPTFIMWEEDQVDTTNGFGLFQATVGEGVRTGGLYTSFHQIPWAEDKFFLMVEYIPTQGTRVFLGITQFMSVPYALVAGRTVKSDIPVGTIVAYGGDSANVPDGWLLCDGRAMNQLVYPELFTAIGNNYGSMGSFFRLPDLRGRFLRGVDYGAGNDPTANARTASNSGGNVGNRPGSLQGDEIRSHTHDLNLPGRSGNNAFNSRPAGWGYDDWTGAVAGATTTAAGGSETRPKNIYVNFIIKH